MHPRLRHARLDFLLVLLTAMVAVHVPKADIVAMDPGPQSGPARVGGPLPELSMAALRLFLAGKEATQEID